jgi:hypothetical protein
MRSATFLPKLIAQDAAQWRSSLGAMPLPDKSRMHLDLNLHLFAHLFNRDDMTSCSSYYAYPYTQK